MTEIICRNCFDRNETLVKKILQVREKFESSKTKLRSERSVAYTKRMQKKDSSCVEPVARKSLFQTESVVEKPHRAKTLKTRSSSTRQRWFFTRLEQSRGRFGSSEASDHYCKTYFGQQILNRLILLFSCLCVCKDAEEETSLTHLQKLNRYRITINIIYLYIINYIYI